MSNTKEILLKNMRWRWRFFSLFPFSPGFHHDRKKSYHLCRDGDSPCLKGVMYAHIEVVLYF